MAVPAPWRIVGDEMPRAPWRSTSRAAPPVETSRTIGEGGALELEQRHAGVGVQPEAGADLDEVPGTGGRGTTVRFASARPCRSRPDRSSSSGPPASAPRRTAGHDPPDRGRRSPAARRGRAGTAARSGRRRGRSARSVPTSPGRRARGRTAGRRTGWHRSRGSEPAGGTRRARSPSTPSPRRRRGQSAPEGATTRRAPARRSPAGRSCVGRAPDGVRRTGGSRRRRNGQPRPDRIGSPERDDGIGVPSGESLPTWNAVPMHARRSAAEAASPTSPRPLRRRSRSSTSRSAGH